MKKVFTFLLACMLVSFAAKSQNINFFSSKPNLKEYANTICETSVDANGIENTKSVVPIAYSLILKPNEMDLMMDTTAREKLALLMSIDNKIEKLLITAAKSNKDQAAFENSKYLVKITMPTNEAKADGIFYLYNNGKLISTKRIIFRKD